MGGELFKGGFQELFKLEWNSLQETRLGIVSQETKHKTAKHQKNYQLFLRNNQLFIPAKQQQLNLNEFKGRKRYTNSLYWFTLKPRATSSPHNPLGNPLSNQLQITHKTTKQVTLIPSRNTLPLAQHTLRMLILTTSRAHNPSWLYNTRIYKVFRTNYTCYRMNWNQYRCNPIPLSLEKTKAEKWNIKSWKQTLKNSNLFFSFLVCYKTLTNYL